jgi:hypothetical protein
MLEGFTAETDGLKWLEGCAGGWQFGEQAILATIAVRLQADGQCVEIGAGDGEGLPLTIEPWYNRGDRCLLYERDSEARTKLQSKFPNATIRGEFSESWIWDAEDEIAVCVIDVDGIDSTIMIDVLAHCRPTILMVEHFDMHHERNCESVAAVPAWLMGLPLERGFRIQDNAATINRYAAQYQYARVGRTRVNSIFVRDTDIEKLKG